MFLKRFVLFQILFVFLFIGFCFAKDSMHPINKIILKLNPHSYKLKWPDVPRILPDEAKKLYDTNQALFIGVGAEARPLPKGLCFKDAKLINKKWLKKISSKRLVVLYCP